MSWKTQHVYLPPNRNRHLTASVTTSWRQNRPAGRHLPQQEPENQTAGGREEHRRAGPNLTPTSPTDGSRSSSGEGIQTELQHPLQGPHTGCGRTARLKPSGTENTSAALETVRLKAQKQLPGHLQHLNAPLWCLKELGLSHWFTLSALGSIRLQKPEAEHLSERKQNLRELRPVRCPTSSRSA